MSLNISLGDEKQTLAIASRFAKVVQINKLNNLLIYLKGDLGAGKTTFVRGFIQALGYDGKVKSPTYNIVEPYQVGELKLYHFDFYKLQSLEELELLGIRDYFEEAAICFIEWPENGKELLPQCDLQMIFSYTNQARTLTTNGYTTRGKNALSSLESDYST